MTEPSPAHPAPERDHSQEPRPAGMPRLLTFRRRHRLTHAREFQAAFAAKLRKSAGPLTVFLNPTDHPEPRLGLSIGRRVGNAVVRNRLKRHLREAFRHLRADLPAPLQSGPRAGSYDVVVSARAHTPLAQGEYRSMLASAIRRAHTEHERRLRRSEER